MREPGRLLTSSRDAPSLRDAYLRARRGVERTKEVLKRDREFGREVFSSSDLTVHGDDTGGSFLFARAENPIPADILLTTSEAVGHLRSALDYLVHELAWLDSGEKPGTRSKTQFPVEDTLERFNDRRRTFLAGVSDAHAAEIALLQPFNGCLWTELLRDLSNPDKHRELLTVQHNTGLGIEIFTEPVPSPPGAALQTIRFEFRIFVGIRDGTPIADVLEDLGRRVLGTLDQFSTDVGGGAG